MGDYCHIQQVVHGIPAVIVAPVYNSNKIKYDIN